MNEEERSQEVVSGPAGEGTAPPSVVGEAPTARNGSASQALARPAPLPELEERDVDPRGLLESLTPERLEPELILEQPRELLERALYQQEGYWSRLLTPEERLAMLDYIRMVSFSLAWQLRGEEEVALIPDELRQPVSLQVLLEYCAGVFKRLARIIAWIDRSPNERLLRQRVFVEFSRSKNVGGRTLAWLMAHPDVQQMEQVPSSSSVAPSLRQLFSKQSPEGRQASYLPKELPETQVLPDYNTYENRFLRSFLGTMHRDLDMIGSVASSHGEEDIRLKAEALKRGVRELQQYDFLKNAAPLRSVRRPSVVFQKQPHYHQAYEIYRFYRRVFSFDWSAPLFQLPLRQTWLLYEYWCFFQVAAALQAGGFQPQKEGTTLLFEDLEERLVLDLPKGSPSFLAFQRPSDGAHATLVYGGAFRDATLLASPGRTTRAVAPTILLLVGDRAVALDVRFKGYAAEESWQDDVDRLHSYRDAIRPDGVTVQEAWGLYPGRVLQEEGPGADGSAQAAPEGVGLLPLHPGEERMAERLSRLLGRWISLPTPQTPQGGGPAGERAVSWMPDEHAGNGAALAQAAPAEERGESPQQFQGRAREAMSQLLGLELRKDKLNVQAAVKEFDMVSGDGKHAGGAEQLVDRGTASLPTGKRASIAEQVWLLQNLPAQVHRFLVFGHPRGDRTLSTKWLTDHEGLLQGIEFYFLDEKTVLSLWTQGGWRPLS